MPKKILTTIFSNPYVWIYIVSFLGIHLFYQVHTHENFLTLRVYMNAEKGGVVNFSFKGEGGSATKSYARKIAFPPGSKGHLIQMPAWNDRLAVTMRFNDKTNRILLSRMTLERNRKLDTLNLGKYFEGLESTPGIKWTPQNDGIMLTLEQGSPAFSLHGLRIPRVWPIIFTLLMLPLPLVIFCQTKLAGDRGRTFWAIRISIIALVVLYWHGVTDGNMGPWQINLATAMAALSLTLWAMTFRAQTGPNHKFEIAGAVVLIVLFMGLIFIPAITTFSPKMAATVFANMRGSLEANNYSGLNAKLKGVQHTFENSYVSGFHNRKELIKKNAWIKMNIFGNSPSPKAIYGKNGMFFEGYGDRRVEEEITTVFDNVTDYVGRTPFSTEDLEKWRQVIEERYFWLKEQGIGYIFALAPTKAQVYPENLPDRILAVKHKLNRPTRYDQLIDYLKQHCAAPVVDLRSALQSAKHEPPYLPLYYRTDFHWNYYGAFIAYRAIMDAINDAYPHYRLISAELSEFDIDRRDDWVHQRFLTMIGLDPMEHRDETFFTFYPKAHNRYNDVEGFLKKGISDYTLPERKLIQGQNQEYHVREYRYDSGTVSKILIMGDSFIEKSAPYFSVHGRNTLNYRAVDHFPIAIIKDIKPDIVVQELLNMYILKDPPINPKAIKR
jgi:SGNH hydrolase-like domain, acetyltransferase AlgX